MHRYSAARLGVMILSVLMVVGLIMPMSSHAQGGTATPTTASSTAGDTPKFQIIQMVSATNGWAVTTIPDVGGNAGGFPGAVYAGTIGYVLHTQDGGQTWANVTPQTWESDPAVAYGCDCTDNALAGFYFLDDRHAWIATDDVGLPSNQIYAGIDVLRTSYSGHSWQDAHQALSGPFAIMFSFSDLDHGWLLIGNRPDFQSPYQPAILYRTLDGGANWQLVADDGQYDHDQKGPISKQDGITPYRHTGMDFESADSGWMTVSEFADSAADGAALLHTTDGGKTWHTVNMQPGQPPTDVMLGCDMSDLRVYSPGSIRLVVDCYDNNAQMSQGFIYSSVDDGKNWQHILIPANFLDVNSPLQIFMISPTVGWAIGCDVPPGADPCNSNPSGALAFYRTVDAGKTWSKTAPVPDALRPVIGEYNNATVAKIDFIDDHTGWAIDPAGHLFTTTDAGLTWKALPPRIGVSTADAN